MIGTAVHARSRCDHLEPVEVGQAEVQDDDVGLSRLGLAESVRARRRLEQSIAVTRERGAQEAPDLRLILDEDDDRLLAEGRGIRLAGGGRRATRFTHRREAPRAERRRSAA